MNVKLALKNMVEKIPYNPGHLLSAIPYRYRLGKEYTTKIKEILFYEQATDKEKYNYILNHLNKIVQYAQKNIPFYKKLYGNKLLNIKSLNDFEQLPIITKEQVREYTKEASGYMKINSGGSTGDPLSFYIDKNSWAREWAHMHYIWRTADYTPNHLMITMLGKNIGDVFAKYNVVHNEFRLNPYLNASEFIQVIVDLFKSYPIHYFQGYPSNIYNFFKEIESCLSDEEKILIKNKIKCCFFSSEYPLPYMVDYIEKEWNLKHLSWYGHSEMCVLAHENNNMKYKPFTTYGFAEEVNNVLVGTSFHNYDMPLIRYSTDDIIEANKNAFGFINDFKITKGRNGDFITDKNNRKIALTSLLYGRHHKIFNIAKFVQIHQKKVGFIVFYITLNNDYIIDKKDIPKYIDVSNIELDFEVKFLKKPVLTPIGKLKALLLDKDVALLKK